METRNKLGYKEIERIKNDSLSTDHRPTEIAVNDVYKNKKL